MADQRETSWDYIVGSSTGTLFTTERKWINKINRLKEVYPDKVDILKQNRDGSILVRIPSSWFKISPPRQSNLSDEQKEAARQRLAKARENKR